MSIHDEYLPTVTFVPQCSYCEKVRNCAEGKLRLYRQNYIKCDERVSEERYWEPDATCLYLIEEELEKRSHLYTTDELAEARETLAKLTE